MLDEPTSGLDSLTSYIIVSYLSRLAHLKNRTIITTIHQPNSETFALFDNLILMVDGKFVYDGTAKYAHKYFS
jgi:ABC-type multidrug transport system ATPase subunit